MTTCGARRTKSPDQLCRRPAGWGTDHPGAGRCKLHGGRSQNGNAYGLRMAAAAELAKLDVSPVHDPLAELARLAGQACAWRDAIAQKVNELTELRFTDDKRAEQLRSEVALFERALDRCNVVLSSMARLNIDERLAKITERQADLVENAVTAAILAAELTAAQSVALQKALDDQLRELM